MTISLYLLRCFEANMSVSDLDQLDTGMVLDIFVEKSNDSEQYDELATQEDFDRF